MRFQRTLIPAAALLAGLLWLGACGGDSAPTALDTLETEDALRSSTGGFELSLIDAPAPCDDILLVVCGVSVHRADEDTLDGWYELPAESSTVHLLDLTNGVSALLADAELPAGAYNLIRVLLGEGNLVVVDGQEFPLTVPSGTSRGLQIRHEFEVDAGGSYAATLDLDASRSLHVTGEGQYLLKPVLRAVATAASGSIAGIVAPVQAAPLVWTVAGTDTVSTLPDPVSGEFRLMALPAGTYTLHVTPEDAAFWSSVEKPLIEVAEGLETDVGMIFIMPAY